ncbi:hypothetical protein ACP4OV_014800 [Aristida adscensionis]
MATISAIPGGGLTCYHQMRSSDGVSCRREAQKWKKRRCSAVICSPLRCWPQPAYPLPSSPSTPPLPACSSPAIAAAVHGTCQVHATHACKVSSSAPRWETATTAAAAAATSSPADSRHDDTLAFLSLANAPCLRYMEHSWKRLVQGLASLTMSIFTHADEYVRPPAGSPVLVPHGKPAHHPQQVHVSIVGPSSMRVSWVTDDRSAPSVVEYGTSPARYTASATGGHATYSYFLYESGAIHHVTIGPLRPGTTYYYRCGEAGGELALRTPPAAPPVEFVVVGDLGQTAWTASTLAHVAGGGDHDVLLLPGDLSYADAVQPRWDSWGRLVQPLASARPWMVTAGNHEIEASLAVAAAAPPPFAAYGARWRMPHEESGSASNLYYSFDAGGGAAHVVMLGSYAAFGEGSPQRRWLEADLARVDRRRTPWVVAVLHAPWYNTNAAHQGDGEAMRRAMERLLYDARVDVVFAGHVHAYERFFDQTRIYDNEPDSRGPMYITIGDGGNREGLAVKFIKDHKSAPLSVFREASFGHGRLRIIDETSAVWRWHRNDDEHATIRDEVWLRSLAAAEPEP